MLSAFILKGGQAPYLYYFLVVLMSFYLELELVKLSARTRFNATSDTVSEETD